MHVERRAFSPGHSHAAEEPDEDARRSIRSANLWRLKETL